MTTQDTNTLGPTNEIVGTVLANTISAENLQELMADPQAFLLSNSNHDIGDNLKIEFANNDDKTMHLALPYYSDLEEFTSEELSDSDAAEVAGGFEIVWTIGMILAAIGAAVGGTAAPIATGAAVVGGVTAGVVLTAGAVAGTGVAADHVVKKQSGQK